MGLTDHDLEAWPITARHDDGTVSAWRIERFLELGYTVDQALELAELRVDHHDVENLIRQGCPPATAIAILS